MKDISKTTEPEVILDSEWSQHELHQRRMRWVELGQQFGNQIDDYNARRNTSALNVNAEVGEVCLA